MSFNLGRAVLQAVVAAATVMLILLVLATAAPARAATYVFDVAVTERTECVNQVCSTTAASRAFQVAFTLHPTDEILGPYGSGYLFQEAYGDGGLDADALAADALAVGGSSQADLAASYYISKAFPPIYNPAAVVKVEAWMSAEAFREGGDGDGVYGFSSYRLLVSHIPLLFAVDPFVGSGPLAPTDIANLLEHFAPLQFREEGTTEAYYDDRIESRSVGYYGTARFNRAESAIPEPAAWALMILGFGLSGAALRRRRICA